MIKKYMKQGAGIFVIGILIYLIGDRMGIIPAIFIPLGVIFAIGGVVGFILALILGEPDEIGP